MFKLFTLLVLCLLNVGFYGQYRTIKLSNDLCESRGIYEGSVKVLAEGNSGPYTVTGPFGLTKIIPIGQTSVAYYNLPEGFHKFTITNSYGCTVQVTSLVLKVNCGICPESPSISSYHDYPLGGSSSLSGVTEENLALLNQYFTSSFEIDNDLPVGKICIMPTCDESSGAITYSDKIELNNRLKDANNYIQVELTDASNRYMRSTANRTHWIFEDLAAASYTLEVFLVTPDTVLSISKRQFTIPYGSKEFCNNKNLLLRRINSDTTRVIASESFSFEAYPNPFGDNVQLNINTTQSTNIDISITNSHGAIVYQKENFYLSKGTNNQTITLQDLAAGVYTIALKTDTETLTERIIKID